MKRLLVALAAVFLFTALGPVPSANAWWWHHHSNSSSKSSAPATPKSPKPGKTPKQPKTHKEKHQRDTNTGSSLYSVPKSVGWWHKMPGPAGAGS